MFFLFLRENVMIALRLLVQVRPLRVITRNRSFLLSVSYDAFATHADSSPCSFVLIDSNIGVHTANHAAKCHCAYAVRCSACNGVSLLSLRCGFRELKLKIVSVRSVRVK